MPRGVHLRRDWLPPCGLVAPVWASLASYLGQAEPCMCLSMHAGSGVWLVPPTNLDLVRRDLVVSWVAFGEKVHTCTTIWLPVWAQQLGSLVRTVPVALVAQFWRQNTGDVPRFFLCRQI